ncbi:DUF5105 domain-containing protein [Clostridium sp. HCP1S3_B4]|uniref:DUF5105 domain-containing protein n=1 Tax=unclassified Clostridium TaxID=2614128 RepID=UPI0016B9475C|nr:DUF5105 domain-containing protein [Clostridium sp.]NLK24075.1 DUF5105 domain-containing protein [Clostridiales bacterium]
MKKRKAVHILFILAIITMFMGCSNKAENVVNDYFKKVQNGEVKFEDLIEQPMEDKVIDKIESDKFSKQYIDKMYSEFDNNIKNVKYKINSHSTNGDESTVNVTVIGDNLSNNFKQVLTQTVKYVVQQAYLDNKMSQEEVNKYMSNLISEIGQATSSERTSDITLEKVNGKWQVKNDSSLTELITGIDNNCLESISSEFERIFKK